MEKECGICGKYFITNNSARMYCDDCSQHYRQKKREYTNAYIASKKRMYEPEVIERTCGQCGKTYKTIYKLLIGCCDENGIHKNFCARKCYIDFKQERAFCSVCGKSMVGNNRFNINNTTGTFYCSDECEEKGKYEIAKKNGWVRKCVHCGKEFIRKDGYFCSADCHRAAVKDGWKSPKKNMN